MVKHLSAFLLIFIMSISWLSAQEKDTTANVHKVHVPYSFNFPSNDLKNRFSYHSELGLGFEYQMGKFSWYTSGSFMFGRVIKDTMIFDNITTAEGQIINMDGEFADIRLYERGYNVFTGLGYEFYSSRYLSVRSFAQVGYMNHRIRIEVIGNNVPQLDKTYKRGYDRMCGGLATREFLGVYYSGDRDLANFYLGLEFTQGFTKSLRSYDYHTMGPMNEERFDTYTGIKFGWILPLNPKSSTIYYYN